MGRGPATCRGKYLGGAPRKLQLGPELFHPLNVSVEVLDVDTAPHQTRLMHYLHTQREPTEGLVAVLRPLGIAMPRRERAHDAFAGYYRTLVANAVASFHSTHAGGRQLCLSCSLPTVDHTSATLFKPSRLCNASLRAVPTPVLSPGTDATNE